MKKTNLLFITTIVIASFSLPYYSCTKDRAKAIPPAPKAACDTMKVSYVKHIEPIFAAECGSVNGCHEAGSAIDLSSYSAVILYVKNNTIRTSTIDQSINPMPKGSAKLPNAQIQLIDCWLKNGHLEN